MGKAQDINLGSGGADTIWKGTQAGAAAGFWMDLGDLSGDNRRDLVIGSPGTGSLTGAVYVLYGGPENPGEHMLSEAHVIINSTEAGNRFGASTATGNILQIEGSTPRELLVGAPGASGGRGAVYLFSTGWEVNTTVTAATAVLTIIGAAGDALGTAIATGDLDNDGFREIIIGAPGTAKVYVIKGGASLSGTIDLSVTAAAGTYTAPGVGAVLAAGDVTGDNIYDLMLGSPSSNLVFVFPGADGTLPTVATASFSGTDTGDEAGTALRILDLDADGKRDLVITAPGGDGPANDRADAGETYVYFGPIPTGANSLASAPVVFFGSAANMRSGAGIAAGDINRDTPNDLVLHSGGAAAGAGQLDIYYGRARTSMGTVQLDGRRFVDFAVAGTANRRIFGDSTAGSITYTNVFEVTGEGARDIIVGVAGADAGAGRVYFAISPKLRISTTSLSLTVNEGGSVTSPTPVQVVNPSTVFIGWEATTAQSWLSTSPSAGSIDLTHPGSFLITAASQGLTPGTHTGTIVVSSTSEDLLMSGPIDVTLTVTGGRMALDTPVNGTEVATTFTVAGWAVDVAATSGTGISEVQVWAYPNFGSGEAGSMIGTATYGHARTDVGAAYGAQFTNSGYSLSVSSLAPGTYQIAVFAKSTVTNTFIMSRSAVVTVVSGTPNTTPTPTPNPDPGTTPTPTPPTTEPEPEGPNENTRISINRTSLSIGAIAGGGLTSGPQRASVLFSNGTASWTASADVTWLEITGGSGTGAGSFTVSLKAGNYPVSTQSGTITVTAPGVPNSPISIPVTLRVMASTTAPAGVIDTPLQNSTGVSGAIAVTGWVLDDLEVTKVEIFRDPLSGEHVSSANGKIFIGRAVFVDGARPDIDGSNEVPFDYQAGWGYMLLTNMLPNEGNGTFTLHAYATDVEGNVVSLATTGRTITCNNAEAVKPFGAIDTPDQGGTVSGTTYTNFGWALTAQPNEIPTDGSTIMVFIDGVPVGRPVYNNARADIAALFPNRKNTNGAVGYFTFDTTTLANGVHTIAWSVTDNAGNAEGIGSRYFTVLNSSSTSSVTLERSSSTQEMRTGTPETVESSSTGSAVGTSAATLAASVPVSEVPVYRRDGFAPNAALEFTEANEQGIVRVEADEAGRFALTLSSPVSGEGGYEGYLVVDGQLAPLPTGSFLDSRKGNFYWQPGVGFLGTYNLLFVRSENGERVRIPVEVTIGKQPAGRQPGVREK